MVRIFRLAVICLFFTGCFSLQRMPLPPQRQEPQPNTGITWIILDYQGKDLGGIIPSWVNLYLHGNTAMIENMVDFQNQYVFISANTGTNFSALRQWNAAFLPDLDIARLAAARIEKRFLDAALTYPDDEYGSYFESLIRTASDAQWSGAVKRGDFWLLRSFPDPLDPEASRSERYDFFILVTVEKELLARQIKTILANTVPEEPLVRSQRNAVSRVQDKFFEGF